MNIYKITEASDYLGVSINTLKSNLMEFEKEETMPKGRKEKLNKEQINTIVDISHDKESRLNLCSKYGITEQTYYNYKRRYEKKTIANL